MFRAQKSRSYRQPAILLILTLLTPPAPQCKCPHPHAEDRQTGNRSLTLAGIQERWRCRRSGCCRQCDVHHGAPVALTVRVVGADLVVVGAPVDQPLVGVVRAVGGNDSNITIDLGAPVDVISDRR